MNDRTVFLITMAVIYIFWTLTFVFIDLFSRKGVHIGVFIGTENTGNSEVRSIRSEYKRDMIISGIASVAIALLISYYTFPGAISYSTIIVVMMATFGVYLSYNKKLKRWKKENLVVKKDYVQRVDIKLSKDKLKYGGVPWKLYLIPLLMIVGISVFTFVNYGNVPDKLPMHWDFSGNINRYSDKSFGTLAAMPLVGLFTLIVMLVVNFSIVMMKQQNYNKKPKVGAENILRARVIWSYFLVGMATVMIALFIVAQLMIMTLLKSMVLVNVLTVIIVMFSIITPIIIGLKVGNMGEKLSKDTETGEHKDDDKWILGGTIYYDKEDPTIFVPKRVGIGSTINFGNKKALIIFVSFIVLSLVTSVIIAINSL